MIDAQDNPSTLTEDALYMADERARIACLLGGTGTMRAAGRKYLPQAPAESDDAYKYRLSVSTLYNGMRRTVETLAGKPFSEPIKLGADVPAPIAEWCDDVDLQGRDLHAFAHAVFAAALADGISHILVEYPTVDENAVTVSDRSAIGARPYFLHIRQDQILGWASERIDGVETLTLLRIMETLTVPSGTWLTKRIQQVRVLEPTRWTTYRKDARGEWQMHAEGAVTLGAVPLATVYADRQGYMQARPPLLDLAYLNIEHWQSSSDQSNILHVARVPILFASGFSEGALKIGAGSAISNDDPTSKLIYVEHSGAAIEAGRMSLKDLEERMSLMGAQLLVRKPGSRTATEKAIDSADADSALSLMVRNLEDSLEYALQFMADWEKLGPAGEVELVGEIGGLEDMEIAGLMKARELGLLSAETVFGEMQRRGLIIDDIDWADEWARLTAEGPPIAIGGAFEAPNTAGATASTQTPTQPQASGSAAQVGGPAVVTPAGSAGATAAANETPPALAVAGSKESATAAPDDAASDAAATAAIQGGIAALSAQVADLLARIAAQPAPQAQQAPTINITQPAITVNTPEHPAPVVNVTSAPVTVNTPDVVVAAPVITVNVPEQPAAQINIAPAAITVNTPDINVAAPAITVTAPTVNVTPAPINVAAPTINVTPLAPPVAAPKPLEIAFNTNAAGEITGASVHPPKPREINFKTNSDGEISGASMT